MVHYFVLQKNVQFAHVAMTTVLAVMTTVAMVTVSPVGAVLFSLLCLFVTFVCPAWLLWLQPFKKYDF